jgi:hypothetical protein
MLPHSQSLLARTLRACFGAPSRALSLPAAGAASASAPGDPSAAPAAPAPPSAPASAAPASPPSFFSVFLKELREQLTPIPDMPGVVNTTLLDPPAWRQRTAAEVELAFKLALWMSVTDFRNALALLTGRPTTFPLEGEPEQPQQPPPQQQGAAAAAAGGAADGPPSPAALAVAQALARVPSSEGVRGAALQAAAQLSTLSRDEELRRRLAAMGSEALHLTRDCLDEFLAGYEVRSRVARASRAAPALTPLALTASL